MTLSYTGLAASTGVAAIVTPTLVSYLAGSLVELNAWALVKSTLQVGSRQIQCTCTRYQLYRGPGCCLSPWGPADSIYPHTIGQQESKLNQPEECDLIPQYERKTNPIRVHGPNDPMPLTEYRACFDWKTQTAEFLQVVMGPVAAGVLINRYFPNISRLSQSVTPVLRYISYISFACLHCMLGDTPLSHCFRGGPLVPTFRIASALNDRESACVSKCSSLVVSLHPHYLLVIGD